jgi:hypothetical protein
MKALVALVCGILLTARIGGPFESALAFSVTRTTLPRRKNRPTGDKRLGGGGTSLLMSSSSSSDEGNTTRKNRRVRRKKQQTAEQETINEVVVASLLDIKASTATAVGTPPMQQQAVPRSPPVVELKPRQESRVAVPVQDVRDLVGGRVSAIMVSSTTTGTSTASTTTAGRTPGGMTSSSSSMDDSLQRLLEDARQMQRDEENDMKVVASSGGDAATTIRNAVSMLVTADFFLVCALLLWFLAGIFCQYVIKDDAVQIAFNNIFEPVVRPALGVLMLASVADAVFQQKLDSDKD